MSYAEEMQSDSRIVRLEESIRPALLSMPDFTYASDEVGPLAQRLIRAIEKLTGQPLIRRLYEQYRLLQRPPELFWQDAITALRLDVRLSRDPARILPAGGPLTVIANHPFGVVDGMILCWMVSRIRPDYMIMTHSILYRAPEVRPHILPVDFSGTREALATNIRSRAQALRLLERGGVLIVFPSGGVAKSKTFHGPAEDLDWGPLAARLILRSGADVLPIFFNGQNSRIYQVAAKLHQILKLSLLFHEVSNKIGARIDVSIGDVISREKIRSIGDPKAVTRFLRQATWDARLAG
jgi:putative hemolysin